MELILRWRGPIGPGRFPEAGDDLAALGIPGVYLRVKTYNEGRTVSYVGQSRQLINRFDQHIRDILTFTSALRDPTGAVALARERTSRFAAYNALDDVMALVTAEAARMRFYWAACEDGFGEDYLTLVESALKDRLEAVVGGADAALVCENRQGISEPDIDDDIAIFHDFEALEPMDRDLLTCLLGDGAIRLSVRAMELGDAG